MGHNTDGMQALMQISAGNATEFKRLALATKRFGLMPVDASILAEIPVSRHHNWINILTDSTWEYFNFQDIEEQHAFWPEGISLLQLKGYLEQALNGNADFPESGAFQLEIELGTIGKIQLEGTCTIENEVHLDRFCPKSGPGIITLNREELVAIAKMLGVPYSINASKRA